MYGKLKTELKRLTDKNGKDYYIGALKFPGSIDCTNGVAFMVFTSEKDLEELQISGLKEDDRSRIETEETDEFRR